MSQFPISLYVTSGFSVIYIMEIEESVSDGKMSTTAIEILCKATLLLGFNYSLSIVDKTLAIKGDPLFDEETNAVFSSIILIKFPIYNGTA